jgi:hypothetical protein
MTPDRTMHATPSQWSENEYKMEDLTYHLLKLHELLDVCEERGLRLQGIDIELHTLCWEDVLQSRIRSTIQKNGSICVDIKDAHLAFQHNFKAQRYETVSESSDQDDLDE